MNTVCISTKCLPRKSRGTKHRASPPLQKVGGNVALPTHGSTVMHTWRVRETDRHTDVTGGITSAHSA